MPVEPFHQGIAAAFSGKPARAAAAKALPVATCRNYSVEAGWRKGIDDLSPAQFGGRLLAACVRADDRRKCRRSDRNLAYRARPRASAYRQMRRSPVRHYRRIE